MAIRSVVHPRNSSKLEEKKEAAQVPLNFLLGCSEHSLNNFQLARLAAAANLRKEIQGMIDKLIDELVQASLAVWFKENDRESLKSALENEESVIDWAKRMLRNDGDSISRGCASPEQLRRNSLASALNSHQRNIAAGICASCTEPLARNSLRHCEKHLEMARASKRPEGHRSDPSSRDSHLSRLAMYREQKSRALLAELGLPAGSAAVTLKASRDALLKCMPHCKDDAMTQAELLEIAMIPSRTTGQKALGGLLAAGLIERFGRGAKGSPCRYFRTDKSPR